MWIKEKYRVEKEGEGMESEGWRGERVEWI